VSNDYTNPTINPNTLTTLTIADPNRPSWPYKEIFVHNSKPENFNESEHAMC